MPIPTPNADESQDQYIERCMGEIGGEYEDSDQALAICFDAWREGRRQHREPLRFRAADGPKRAVLSTDAVVETWGWRERLVHSEEAINFTRAKNGLPLHWNHDTDKLIGRVENIELGAGELTGELRFGSSELAQQLKQDVVERVIQDVSIGYVVDAKSWEERDDGVRVANRWTPLEVSLVGVPADPGARIRRRGDQMSDDGTPKVQDIEAARQAGRKEAFERNQAMQELVGKLPAHRRAGTVHELLVRALSDETMTLEAFKDKLLLELGKDTGPAGSRSPDVHPGDDALDKFRSGAALEIRRRMGVPLDDDEKVALGESGFGSMSMRELARDYLTRSGMPHWQGNVKQMVGSALTRAGTGLGHTTSDFADILVDSAGKRAQVAYQQADETWDRWVFIGDLRDFKETYRVQLNSFPDLEEITDGNREIPMGALSDFKEAIQLVEYAVRVTISRQAIINDDLRMFADNAAGAGLAASRKVGDIAYAVLTSNPAMNDGNNLFDATNHANFVASGSGGAPSTATLNAGYTAMATQTDDAGTTLRVRPAHILHPTALRGTVLEILRSQLNPSEGSTTSFSAANIWQGQLNPVDEPRLDAFLATGWYLAAAASQQSTVEVAFLDGVNSPYIDEMDLAHTQSGISLMVRHDIGASALDWRGLYYNYGA
jgi:HK97 family phage prohead protease